MPEESTGHMHGCGHPVRPVILSDSILSLVESQYFEWDEAHKKLEKECKPCICYFCWKEKQDNMANIVDKLTSHPDNEEIILEEMLRNHSNMFFPGNIVRLSDGSEGLGMIIKQTNQLPGSFSWKVCWLDDYDVTEEFERDLVKHGVVKIESHYGKVDITPELNYIYELDIKKLIHYPECWDTAAYPTLYSACWELISWHIPKECPTCKQPRVDPYEKTKDSNK